MINFDEEYDATKGRMYYDICVKMTNSTSWKITKPMRAFLDGVKSKTRGKAKGKEIEIDNEDNIRPYPIEEIKYV